MPLVGAFWTRLGTPTGAAESGAAEEIDRFVSSNRPAAIYFSRQPVKLDRVDLDQYKRLQEFKERLGKTGLLGDFVTPAELKQKLVNHLSSLLSRYIGLSSDSNKAKRQLTTPAALVARIDFLHLQIEQIRTEVQCSIDRYPRAEGEAWELPKLDEKHLFRVEETLAALMAEFGERRHYVSHFYRDSFSDWRPGFESALPLWRGAMVRSENALLWLEFAKRVVLEGGAPPHLNSVQKDSLQVENSNSITTHKP